MVTAAVAGIPEMITHDVHGLFVEQRNEQQLAAAISSIMDDPELACRLGRSARMRAAEKFDMSVNV